MLRLCFLLMAITLSLPSYSQEQLKALIIDGQNNHGAWPKTTMMMKSYLEKTGRFSVDIQRPQFTWKGGKLLEEYALLDRKKYQYL